MSAAVGGLAGVVLTGVLIVGCGAGTATPAPNAAPANVVVGELVLLAKDLAFTPTEATMTAGTALTVVMDNQDAGVPHNVQLLGGMGDGTEVAKTEIVAGVAEASFSIPPLVPGTYRYICEVHPNMTGTLIVVTGG